MGLQLHAETVLSRVAQDFLLSMPTMCMSQMVSAPTHTARHTLSLFFCSGVDAGDLGVEERSVVMLSWIDLVGFRLTGTWNLCRGEGLIKMVHPRRRMGPNGFLMAPGELPVASAYYSVDTLVDLWNGKMARAITSKCPLP